MNKSLFPELDAEVKSIDDKVVDLVPRPVPSREANATEDWWSDNQDVIIQEQLRVAAYVAQRGDICIRQESRDLDDEDACVFVRSEHLKTLIARLTTFLPERSR